MYWHRLLTHFYKKHYFRNGLTLPFIIGSRTIIEPDKKLQSISQLLDEARNLNVYLSVLKCDYIGELVFSISSITDFDIYGGFDNIVDIDGDFKGKFNFIEFCEFLESEYVDTIKKSLYSKNGFGKWEFYTDDIDLPRLKELKTETTTRH